MTGSPSTPTTPACPAADRAARLEALLGDPRDPRNPHGRAALLRADEAGGLPALTEALLAGVSLTAELVPRALGGRLDGLDGLAVVLRPLSRRHFLLGWTRGAAPLAAAAAVWADGTEGQRTAAARLLLGGGRIAALPRAPATGAEPVRGGLRARPTAGGFVVSGYGAAGPDAHRAEALLAYARTGGPAGPRSHSTLLLDVRRLPAGRLCHVPRAASPYGRGARFARVELDACDVPRSQLVGDVGAGVPLEVRTAQVSRCLLPAVAVGGVDSALRDALDVAFAGDRPARRGGRRHRVLAGVFTDLLTGDCLVRAALRTLARAPESAPVAAAAAQYVVSALCRDVLDDLAGVLGARAYEPDPAGEWFRRTVRDLAAAGLGHAGHRGSLGTLVAHLRLPAARVPGGVEPPCGPVFRPGSGPAPPDAPFDAARLAPAAHADVLTAALLDAAARPPGAGGAARALARLTGMFADEVRVLGRRCAALPGLGTAAPALPEALVLADRYAWVLAAAACVVVRQEHEGRSWLGEPDWAVVALGRIARRLAMDTPTPAAESAEAVAGELLRRHRQFRSFDLYGVRLAGQGAALGRR